MVLASTIALALLAPSPAPLPGEPSPEPGSAAPVRATRISTAILRADGFERGDLERAIQLRLPGLTLVEVGSEAPTRDDGSLRAFIELRRVSPTQLELTLILADGRAYLRALEVDADAPARPAAGALANLIAAIEDDAVAPDKSDVPIPPALLVRDPAPPEPTPPVVCPELPVQPPPPPPPAPRWELGPTLRAGASLGVTPLHGLRAAGGALGLSARAPSGLLLLLDLQYLGRALQNLQVQRLRVALGVGYALRRGPFELPIAALLGVEPWRLTGDRGTVPLSSTLGPPRPLLGLGLRLAPGLRAAVGRSGAQLRAGLNLELWASGQAAAGLRHPELRVPPAAVTLGGVELGLGLELGLWFPVGPSPARRPRATSAQGHVPRAMSSRTAAITPR